MNHYLQSVKILEQVSLTQPEILVSYSGGKDSRVVLDLCTRIFKRVVCFFMYFVPGLAVVEEQMQFARERYGVEVRQYPHWALLHAMQGGVYCRNHHSWDDIEPIKLGDIYQLARHETGIQAIAMGAKKTDGFWRRRNLSSASGRAYEQVYAPISEWNRFDVLAYLASNQLPVPDSSRNEASGINLDASTLLWLHDKHPDDFRKVLAYFPFAEAVVYRRQWYGF